LGRAGYDSAVIVSGNRTGPSHGAIRTLGAT
jgi:hypothetical protein